MIDLGRLLKTVLEARTREEIVARVRERKSRKVGIREKLDRIYSHRVKPSLGYRIVGEGCSQVGGVAYVVRIENLDHPPAGVPAIAEVPILFQKSRQRLGRSGLRGDLGAFMVKEEEGLVAAVVQFREVDRAADRCAELVPPGRHYAPAGAIREEVVCVQSAIAQVVEGGAVQLIGSPARHGADHGAAGEAIFGAETVGLELEFLD